MADREDERAARNREVIARMSAPPTKPQVIAELDLEIDGAIHLAAKANLPTLLRILRMAKLEVTQIRRRAEFKP